MMRRRRGVGLVGVAAVAHVAGNRAANKQAAADQSPPSSSRSTPSRPRSTAQAQAPAYAPAPAAAAPAVDPQMAQLQNLANLHTQGILSDEEYTAAKAKALGI